MAQYPQLVPDVNEEVESKRKPIECLTPGMREHAERIPPDVFERTPSELEEMVKPSPLYRQLKMRFWQKYEKAVAQGLECIPPVEIYGDLCSRQLFYYHIVHNPEAFAWILMPDPGFDAQAAEALQFSLKRLRDEILTAPLFNSKGQFDGIVAGHIVSAFKALDARVHGSPLQKIQQQSLHLHKHETVGSVTKDQLNQELEEIKQRLNMSQTPQLAHKVPDDPE